jgi:hypothetical protein
LVHDGHRHFTKISGRFVFRLVSLMRTMALGKAGRAQGKGIAERAQGGTVRILGRAEGMLLGMQGFGLSGQFVSPVMNTGPF